MSSLCYPRKTEPQTGKQCFVPLIEEPEIDPAINWKDLLKEK
jgi:hypothetical protein